MGLIRIKIESIKFVKNIRRLQVIDSNEIRDVVNLGKHLQI